MDVWFVKFFWYVCEYVGFVYVGICQIKYVYFDVQGLSCVVCVFVEYCENVGGCVFVYVYVCGIVYVVDMWRQNYVGDLLEWVWYCYWFDIEVVEVGCV